MLQLLRAESWCSDCWCSGQQGIPPGCQHLTQHLTNGKATCPAKTMVSKAGRDLAKKEKRRKLHRHGTPFESTRAASKPGTQTSKAGGRKEARGSFILGT